MTRLIHCLLLPAFWLVSTAGAFGQAVSVTMSLDTNRVTVGNSAILRVYAQILPVYQTNSDRIFSWYVDLLNSDGTVASGNYAQLNKATSDKDPQTSSSGKTDGPNRRGIYDTFMNLPGAGRSNRVELFNVPVTGVSTGKLTLSVQAGTTVNLSKDFIVGSTNADYPKFGGDYSAANVTLEVVAGPVGGTNQISLIRAQPGQFTISFPLTTGRDHFVESRDNLGTNGIWQTIAGGPHNSGSLTVSNNVALRFFRLRVVTP
jgi:hypothetical protein